MPRLFCFDWDFMKLNGHEITVLGGGIGGVSAAIALARHGARVTVIEQAPDLTEVGAGLQISANGLRILEMLDVFANRDMNAFRSAGTELRDYRSGKLIFSLPEPRAGPTWYFHRADLLSALVETAVSAGVRFKLGIKAASLAFDDDRATVRFSDGKELTAQCLVVADGVRGAGRPAISNSGPARFSGQVAWRAVLPWDADQTTPPCAQVTMAPGRHTVTYPLRGGKLMNLVAVEERTGWSKESWRDQGDPGALRRRFNDFGGDVQDILKRVDTVHVWGLHLHPVAENWHRGSAVLLGDAAHPTLPFMAQGACLAIEDAWVLADCLANAQDMAHAFAAYEAKRKPRAQRVVATATANAWRFHAKSPFREIGQLGLRLAGRWLAPNFEWIYGYDATGQSAT